MISTFHKAEGQTPQPLLVSSADNYLMLAILGEGCFGKVIKCLKLDTNETVAVKVLKKNKAYVNEAKNEVSMLKNLSHLDLDMCNIVKWYTCFMLRSRMCLVFEMLDISLWDYMEQRHFSPLPLKEARLVVQQLATAFDTLKAVGVIHTDLKPDNIMLVDHVRQPFRVKLIDFGLAFPRSRAKMGSTVQPLPYRSPEIILGLPFSEAIDMWSLGCVMVDLFLGCSLCPGQCEYEVLQFIIHTQGEPGDELLKAGLKTECFFRKQPLYARHKLWRLKTPEEYTAETGVQSRENRHYTLNSLDDLKEVESTPTVMDQAEVEDRLRFVDLMKRMLQMDAGERITPGDVLAHPFITMSHLSDSYHDCSHEKASFLYTCTLEDSLDGRAPSTTFSDVRALSNSLSDVRAPSTAFSDVRALSTTFSDVRALSTAFSDVRAPSTAFSDVRALSTAFSDMRAPSTPFSDVRALSTAFSDMRAPSTPFSDVRAPSTTFSDIRAPSTPFSDVRAPSTPFSDVRAPSTALSDIRAPYTTFSDVRALSTAVPGARNKEKKFKPMKGIQQLFSGLIRALCCCCARVEE